MEQPLAKTAKKISGKTSKNPQETKRRAKPAREDIQGPLARGPEEEGAEGGPSRQSLVIVESPSKAKTISKYLGRKFKVMASIGHVKDLPKSKFGIDIERGFTPEYVVIKGKAKILSEIKKAARGADRIYLAPDPDREGEAIAWHIAQEMRSSHVYRVLFNEITEKGIQQAMQSPGEIDLQKVNAQQARRIMDRIVGYKISPLLWEKVRYGLSAGRVQSVTVRLICEREREVLAFIPVEYWSVEAYLLPDASAQTPFIARLIQCDNAPIQIHNRAEAEAIVATVQTLPFAVSKVEKKEKRRYPAPPFITSRLQQEGVRKLSFTPKKTMMLAQQLYEGIETRKEGPVGLITYMRTDSVRVSPDFQREARAWIERKYGRDYIPETPHLYKSKKAAQEGHEAIRPTDVQRGPEELKGDLTKDQYLLYRLIWNRFVASLMTPALFDATQVDITAGSYLFRANGAVVTFPGFTIVYIEGREEEDEEEKRLPELAAYERLALQSLDHQQHFTQPPPRYNEALLIHDLEEQDIGRPSTYASIISTIQEREYVEKSQGRFSPTDLGKTVNALLVEHFPDIMNVAFTAQMENALDEIEEGAKEWGEIIRNFYEPFQKDFDKAQVEMKNVKRQQIETDIPCEKCGALMAIKWGRFGRYLSCVKYPDCKNTKEFTETPQGIQIVEKETKTDDICQKCGKPMVIKTGRFGRFLACSGYPDCDQTRPVHTGVACPEEGCGGILAEKRSRRGKVFFSCDRYPKCKFALWDRPLPRPCPQCQAPFLVEKPRKNGPAKTLCRNKACGYEEVG